MTTGNYVLAPALQQIFINKDTQQLLANGQVNFYKDDARTERKDIFQQSGSPPDYTYVTLPNPVILNSSGSPQNAAGQQVELYYFPYDDNGNIEKYYIEVFSSDGILQFTVEGYPDVVAGNADSLVEENFIANGQFLAHTDIPADTALNLSPGEVRQPVTDIAWGGWSFVRDASPSTLPRDIVLFDEFGPGITNPTRNPRYAVRIECETAGSGETTKDLRIRFNDVNRFSSAVSTFTFGFTGKVNAGSQAIVVAYLYKFYGTSSPEGPTPSVGVPTPIPNGSFTLNTSYQTQQVTFTFGTNEGKTIGNNNDDYVEIILRMPLNTTFNLSCTNFLLTEGSVPDAEFPYTTDRNTLAQSLGGGFPVPNPDGSDLFLPVILSKSGWMFDHSRIGMVEFVPYTDLTNSPGKMAARGQQYAVKGYCPHGIPYARLHAVYMEDSTNGIPLYGTGLSYATTLASTSVPTNLQLFTNTAGAVTNTADGATSTGFTFTTIHKTATGTDYDAIAYLYDGQVLMECTGVGPTELPLPVNGTPSPGFTFSRFYPQDNLPNFNLVPQKYRISVVAAATIPAGSYFNFTTYNSVSVQVGYYVWFTIDGVGVDPAPANRTGISLALLSTDTDIEVLEKLREALNGFQISVIGTVDGATVSQNSYFTFSTQLHTQASAVNYVVWFNKDASGTAPVGLTGTLIEVPITTENTAVEIATTLATTLNSQNFWVPDYRGMFIRGWDDGSGTDPDANKRFSLVPGVTGDKIGTQQFDSNQSHRHSTSTDIYSVGGTYEINAGTADADGVDLVAQGDAQSKPINISLQAIINY